MAGSGVPCPKCAPLVARLRQYIDWLEPGTRRARDWRKAKREERDREIVRLYRRGCNLSQIARLVGLTRGGIWHAVRRLNLR